MAGRTTVTDGEVITFTLDQPLAQPGRYQVNYQMISFDSDFTTGGYFFTFDPAAAQPARIQPSGSASGFPLTTLELTGAGLAITVVLLALVLRRIDNRRRPTTPPRPSTTTGPTTATDSPPRTRLPSRSCR